MCFSEVLGHGVCSVGESSLSWTLMLYEIGNSCLFFSVSMGPVNITVILTTGVDLPST